MVYGKEKEEKGKREKWNDWSFFFLSLLICSRICLKEKERKGKRASE
jgi:hypothetical protein